MAKGQWEFQIFGKGSRRAADEMWMARYLLERLTEKYCIDIEYHCKPLGDTDWNGSGMHRNFSTAYLRETGGKEYFEKLMAAFEAAREDHIAVYGPDNHHAADRQARDPVDPHLQLRRCRPRRVRSASRTASSATVTGVTSRIGARTRKATRTRSPRRS